MLRRMFAILVCLVIVLYVIKQPVSAGHTFTVLAHDAEVFGRALVRFASAL
jgi:hypothetical protein